MFWLDHTKVRITFVIETCMFVNFDGMKGMRDQNNPFSLSKLFVRNGSHNSETKLESFFF